MNEFGPTGPSPTALLLLKVADIQQRVAQLENHTAVPDPNDIRVWPWPHTVDDLAQTVIYLRDELAATNAEANRAGCEEKKLRKRVADLEGQLKLSLSYEWVELPKSKSFNWVAREAFENCCKDVESLKAEIRKLTYDRDTLAKRLADICNIAKKET